ncbi:Regulatory protein PchR [Pedobacter sp. Bi27]|uniref:helix-turn-helix domain-containing protein n=1 Tax=unclassified Pedobacter TaxID=2628915 RepID=UPI001D40E5A7|nr:MULTISPECIES: AraC family transcriptional regulator [unclassified Pedobacter]CAH0147970.1 Regulatory protein PchR [Pedobacter sp. Bi126]CAH0148399.1 Regulatory protein PchR [Pedobacter sp. Bi27]CAH0210373.1 Regulatory protein PchR [Pedobacter sp. Bi36]
MGFELRNDKKTFKTVFDENDFNNHGFKEDAFKINIPFGRLTAKQWLFDGIKIIYSETELDKPTELDWRGDTELVTMHFNLQGRTSIKQDGMSNSFELNGNQHNLFYGTSAEGKMKFDELRMKSFMIQFAKDSFLTMSKDGNDSLKQFAEKIVSGTPIAFSNANLNIDLPLQTCINSILNCDYTSGLKRLFLLSKTIELLVLQAESFNNFQNSKSEYIKHDYDKERIVFARDYLVKNIESPPTLVELAKIVGINEYKLKRGFKEMFNQTAFSYLSDLRLDLAKNDLLEGKKQATEIAFELGYCSLQHFSSAFKRKFAIPPSRVRR